MKLFSVPFQYFRPFTLTQADHLCFFMCKKEIKVKDVYDLTQTKEHIIRDWKKNIALFFGGQTISLFGSSLVQYAIMWHITLTTESGMMMTLYIICGFIPTFILSPVAGVWADRYNRKNTDYFSRRAHRSCYINSCNSLFNGI